MPPEYNPETPAWEEWTRQVQHQWEKAGHYEKGCDGWSDALDGSAACTTCGEGIPLPERRAA
jgi:hypothetical protein